MTARKGSPRRFRCYEDGTPLIGIEVCRRHPGGARVPWAAIEDFLWIRVKSASKFPGGVVDLVREEFAGRETMGPDEALEIVADGEVWSANCPVTLAHVANRFRVWSGVLSPFADDLAAARAKKSDRPAPQEGPRLFL